MSKNYKPGLLSFIVPCYNGSKYIVPFFKSIKEQTYANIEIIIVDDGSTDDSAIVAMGNEELLKSKGITLKYIWQENGGIGRAINTALPYVEGEFFTWFGIDDRPLPEYSKAGVNFLNNNHDFALVRINGYCITEDVPHSIVGKMADVNHDKSNPYIFWNAVNEKNFQFGYSILRTEVFEHENNGLDIYPSREGQNWQLLLPVIYKHKSGYIDEPLYNVLEHQNSVSRSANGIYDKKIAQIREYKKILIETINRMTYILHADRVKALSIVETNYAHRIFRWAIGNFDYSSAAKEYKYLRQSKTVTREEIREYRRRFIQFEYWLHLKHLVCRSAKK